MFPSCFSWANMTDQAVRYNSGGANSTVQILIN